MKNTYIKSKKKRRNENYKNKSNAYIKKKKENMLQKLRKSLEKGARIANRRGHVYEGERLSNYNRNRFKPPPPLYRSYKNRSRKRRNPYNY